MEFCHCNQIVFDFKFCSEFYYFCRKFFPYKSRKMVYFLYFIHIGTKIKNDDTFFVLFKGGFTIKSLMIS